MQREESGSVLAQVSWEINQLLSKKNPGTLVGDNELLYGQMGGAKGDLVGKERN